MLFLNVKFAIFLQTGKWFTFRKCTLSMLIKESAKVREKIYFMTVNKIYSVMFQTGICALIYAHPSKYGMTQGNVISNKQFWIVYYVLDLFTLCGICFHCIVYGTCFSFQVLDRTVYSIGIQCLLYRIISPGQTFRVNILKTLCIFS